ncbi:hypothetical protein [Helicobacter pylori]|nr:hypothetical protein [Helicobacter pylori]
MQCIPMYEIPNTKSNLIQKGEKNMKKTLLLSLSLSRFCSTLKTTAFTQA